MKLKYIIAGVIIIILVTIFYQQLNKEVNPYSFSGKSFSYSQDRGKLSYYMILQSVNDSLDTYNISYVSRPFMNYSTTIYGLIIIPSNKTNLPGLVLLPGGGVKKEDESRLAKKIAKLGYAVITIDQRGIGQTGGYYLSIEQDYSVFSQGYEPIQHLEVFDALRAFDVLSSLKQVDKNNIVMSGESMGGRYAIIATALDSRIKGALIISSSGYHFNEYENLPYTPYLVSIDPDNYISHISPRKLFMTHSLNDTVIPIKDSQETFDKAAQPKQFYSFPECGHGYCDKLFPIIEKDLKELYN